jgi:acyl-CoA synthetase (AMP-forming)/AMP-acid ligase II
VRPDTLQQLLLRARERPGTGIRFADAAERETFLSWETIAARAERVAGGLRARGVAAGERVALVYPTGEEFFPAFFGTLLAGAAPVPLYPPVRFGRLAEYRARTAAMLAAVEAALLLADRRLAPLVGEAAADAPPRLGVATLAELPEESASASAGRPDDLALVQFSSGTTVEPRPVALTHRALLAQIETLNAHWPDTPEVRQSGVSWLPLYHDMGLVGCVLLALERPATLTLLPPEAFLARPALWLRAIARHRATISVGPNFAYALAAERIRDEELSGCDLASWRFALVGAEAVSAETLRGFAARFAPHGFAARALTPVYGLAEATLAVTFSALDAPFRAERFERALLARAGRAEPAASAAEASELVSVGRPLPGFAVELRDERGVRLPERRVGRVFVAGPSLCAGYFGRPEETAAVLRDGWLDTGDLGFLERGDLFLVGRAKDVLVVRGANHAPVDLERAVDRLPGVRTGCAAAVAYRAAGAATDRLLLLVECRRGTDGATRAALPAACRAAVLAATGLALDEVHVLEPGTLPRTSSGKIRRGDALRRHLDGTLAPPAGTGFLRLALALLRGRRALGALARRLGRGGR